MPSASTALMPLNSGGLCEAVTITPPEISLILTKYCKVGVGSAPSSSTSQPTDVSPAATADRIMSALVRQSVAKATLPFMRVPIALPTSKASWGSMKSFTTPRTPLVPKSRWDIILPGLVPLGDQQEMDYLRRIVALVR